MNWHTYAEKFSNLEGQKWEDFKADIKERGVQTPLDYRVLPNGQKQGLDGRQRARACAELGIDCPMNRVEIADADVKTFIIGRNVLRRGGLDPETRQEVVADLRAEGQSTRTIAEKVGVNHSTVMRDLKTSGGAFAPPAEDKPSSKSVESNGKNPSKVTGRDGKLYPANQPRTGADCVIKRNGINPNHDAKNAAARKASGKTKFQTKGFDQPFGQLVRIVDEAIKVTGKHADLDSIEEHLRHVLKLWNAWKKNLA